MVGQERHRDHRPIQGMASQLDRLAHTDDNSRMRPIANTDPTHHKPTTARGRTRPRLSSRTIVLVVASPIFAFLLVPTLLVIPMAFTSANRIDFPPSGFSVHAFADFFADPAWTDAALTSFKVAAIAVPLSVVAGTMAAIALHGWSFRGKSLVVAAIMVPAVVPVVVPALADYIAFSRHRLVGTVEGIALAHAVLTLPFVYITVRASLTGLNQELVRSTRSLGGGPVAVLRFAYLPSLRPGVLAGAVFAFAVSFDESVVALFLSGPNAVTLPVKIYGDIQYDFTPTIAAVSSMLVGGAMIVLLAQMAFTLRRRALANVSVEPGLGLFATTADSKAVPSRP
jgi:putative spermidine/putrescine transport system permease protein